jgi:hypothetical protein
MKFYKKETKVKINNYYVINAQNANEY